nr:MAG TPA: hypothetical protein [Caudoviricetes sp.]
MLKSKKIRVLEAGPIAALGGIHGPILSYYRENIETIFAMVRDGVRVIELTPDGSEIPLDIQNYDKENGGTYDEVDINKEPQDQVPEQTPTEAPKTVTETTEEQAQEAPTQPETPSGEVVSEPAAETAEEDIESPSTADGKKKNKR